MGRWSYSSRNTVEDCLSIDVSWLKKHGYFCGYKCGGVEWKNSMGEKTSSIGFDVRIDYHGSGINYIRFHYTKTDWQTGDKKKLDYKVDLISTDCHYGGRRFWFICPLIKNGNLCGRRVGKLYLPPGYKYFGCRHCYDLTYTSCKESHKFDRLFAQIAKGIPGATPEIVKNTLFS